MWRELGSTSILCLRVVEGDEGKEVQGVGTLDVNASMHEHEYRHGKFISMSDSSPTMHEPGVLYQTPSSGDDSVTVLSQGDVELEGLTFVGSVGCLSRNGIHRAR